MNSQILLIVCVFLCIKNNTFADTDEEKCTKMEGQTDLQITTLRKQLLCSYDRETAPVNSLLNNRVRVKIALLRYRLHYRDTHEWEDISTPNVPLNSPNWFVMSAYVILNWVDQRLSWDEKEPNNRTQITFDRSDVWTPAIDAYHGIESVIGTSAGEITSFMWVHLVARCRPISFYWGDQRECVVCFRVHPYDKVQLESSKNDYHYSNGASWSVVKAERIFPLKQGEENDNLVKIPEQMPWKYGPEYFETKVTIQRNFAIQDAVIFGPAVVLLILLISSTCIPAKQEARIVMLSTIVIVLVFMFQQACRTMPFLPEKITDIVALYRNMITCSGAAIVEWFIAFIIANKREHPTTITSHSALPRSSVFSSLKTIFVITENDSRSINTSRLLDRITFLLLAFISFTLVVLQGRRPPLQPFNRGELHPV